MNKYYCTKCNSEIVQRDVRPVVSGYCGVCATTQTLRLLRLKGQPDPKEPVTVVPFVENTVRTDGKGTKLDQQGSGIGIVTKIVEVPAKPTTK